METSLNITRIERPDDIPLLLAQMQKMDVAALLDEHFPTHGNWQGLSLGNVAVGWLAYIFVLPRYSKTLSLDHQVFYYSIGIDNILKYAFDVFLGVVLCL